MSSLRADPLGPHSDVVSTARLLLESKGRRTARKFLVEGPQNVVAAIKHGLADYVLAEHESQITLDAQKARLKVYRISDSANKALSDTKTPQGIYAVCNIPDFQLSDMRVENFAIVMDRISDPGNVGTIIRTAAAFGADAVIALTGSADVWSGKVVRSTAGAFAELPVLGSISESEFLNWQKSLDVETFALAGSGHQDLPQTNLSKPHLWLVGNEAGGLTQSLLNSASKTIRIPMKPNIESLNAAMAVGICAFASFATKDQ